jgi:hypothetical protein
MFLRDLPIRTQEKSSEPRFHNLEALTSLFSETCVFMEDLAASQKKKVDRK